MNGRASTQDDERVTFKPDSTHPDRFIPLVSGTAEGTRPFQADDMLRVMDFEGVSELPLDGGLMYGEDAGPEGLRFPVYHFCLRGGFLFYFDPEDVDEESGHYASYYGPPKGVVPLDKIAVEFPQGGRRVFREHAHTNARTGYELVILHIPNEQDQEEIRPPSFLVADSMSQREKWAKALRARAEVHKPTFLRGGFSTMSRKNASKTDGETGPSKDATTATGTPASKMMDTKTNSRRTKSMKQRDMFKTLEQYADATEDAELGAAILEFGHSGYNEVDWLQNYFQINNDYDAPGKCRQLEQWQTEMKKKLKGAVLEQYEYFVQASGEMTTMGKEVSALKALIETQVITLREMKEIDFSSAMKDSLNQTDGVGDDASESDGELDLLDKDRDRKNDRDDASIFSEVSSIEGEGQASRRSGMSAADVDESMEASPAINIPEWLDDVAEDISSLIRTSRYSEAVDLQVKARLEVTSLIEQHERPTAYRLTKAQRSELKKLQESLEKLSVRICNRLEEILRRKNEALRQSSKRERSDPHAVASPVSPCALNDDAMYLQLLVKIGKTSVAADAYSSRRSLLLQEALGERPISGAGTVDLVIYAAQLSQSFFSCLAIAMEGFLDLFTGAVTGEKQEDGDSLAGSSLHSQSCKNIPAGAVASIVLWCDTELAKFASAFGGARVLANLALSPSPRDGPKKPRVVGETADEASKERNTAIQLAAQCLDQAFLYASQNLDSVGLPLAPRMAELLRPRLKGCEDEVSQQLGERWKNLTADWRMNGSTNGHHSFSNGHR